MACFCTPPKSQLKSFRAERQFAAYSLIRSQLEQYSCLETESERERNCCVLRPVTGNGESFIERQRKTKAEKDRSVTVRKTARERKERRTTSDARERERDPSPLHFRLISVWPQNFCFMFAVLPLNFSYL